MDVGLTDMSPAKPDNSQRLYDRVEGPDGLVERVMAAEHAIDKHEAICAMRYAGIDYKLRWMTALMVILVAATLLEPRLLVQALLKKWGIETTVTTPASSAKPPGG